MTRWPNLVVVARAGLLATIDGRVVTRLPGDLAAQMPVTRITRGPGDDDGVTDSPLLDVETFAATEDGMWTLAEDTRQTILALAGTVAGGALIDTVSTVTGPVAVDYENPAVHRAVASYRFALRRI